MMVIFVSQCEKKALNKTRRVLDIFANRIGDRTWQTVITNEGLNAVKKLLKKTASKNTAVACHWLRSRSRMELVWIIGNRSKFNSQGITPVSTTSRTIVNTQWENDWHYLPLIKSITALAALFHDFGKASMCFQEKLQPDSKNKLLGDPLRHEWVSTLLLNALVDNATDEQWLTRLMNGQMDDCLRNIQIKGQNSPLGNLPPAASLIAWLVVTHHKLPLVSDYGSWRNESAENYSLLLSQLSQEWGYENKSTSTFEERLPQCLKFPYGLPSQSKPWLKQIKKWATRMHSCLPLLNKAMSDGSWRPILLYSRLALMLGDHHYSSCDANKLWRSDMKLFANTYREDGNEHRKGEPKQKLDEHLVGVAESALKITHLLPAFESEPPYAYDIKSLKKKSPPSFLWQDKAVEKIKIWRQKLPVALHSKNYGFFAVNMASTGCGKTFANAKMMRALSEDGERLRYILALGLRTLTLQTGDEYRERIGLDNSELAVLIGSRAVLELHQKNTMMQKQQEYSSYAQFGSESLESLLDDEVVDYECAIPEEGLNTILSQERDRKFLYAPVLVCTIDHMMSLSECKRGGRYILPYLRLMSSDLVIDEIDDFDGEDLIAIGRLIHFAGMLGRKVMISSATIPPDLAQGYFNVYREGWRLFAKTRQVSANIGCAWIDEFNTKVETISDFDTVEAIHHYQSHHNAFIGKRINKLKDAPIKRKAEIISCDCIKEEGGKKIRQDKQLIEGAYFKRIQHAIIGLHLRHCYLDPVTEKMVSFGVVRMANINPCVSLTTYLVMNDWPADFDIRVMAYHSQQVLLVRNEQEKHLDCVLKRNEKRGEVAEVFKNSVIRDHLDRCLAKHMVFILVATPVEEIGRDHDFDWAVVEPSSLRSIIQLSGRVLRHRDKQTDTPNIALMQYNLRALKNTDHVPAYQRPGYEQYNPVDSNYMLATHDITQLIDNEFITSGISAKPRIYSKPCLNPKHSFADLEHYSISKLLTRYKTEPIKNLVGPETMQGWLTQCWWLTALPQQLNPFRHGIDQVKLFLIPQNDNLVFVEKDEKGHPHVVENIYNISKLELEEALLSKCWLSVNYKQLIRGYADEQNLSERAVALKYGELSFPNYGGDKRYQYSLQFGLTEAL